MPETSNGICDSLVYARETTIDLRHRSLAVDMALRVMTIDICRYKALHLLHLSNEPVRFG